MYDNDDNEILLIYSEMYILYIDRYALYILYI